MTEHLFTRAIVGRSEISIVPSRAPEVPPGTFDVYIDGRTAGTVHLGLYYPPSIGVYPGEQFAVWAGNLGAVMRAKDVGWVSVKLDEPIHAIYDVGKGWCVVAELSVVTADNKGRIVSRVMHREVIVTSRWERDRLILEDFEGGSFTVRVHSDLTIHDNFDEMADTDA